MRCPMTFSDPCADRNEECRPDCAWRLKNGEGAWACALALLAVSNPTRFKVFRVSMENTTETKGL